MMTATAPKTKVIVQLLDDKSFKAIMRGVITSLKSANRENDAVDFQVQAVSSNRKFMDIVNDYAEII